MKQSFNKMRISSCHKIIILSLAMLLSAAMVMAQQTGVRGAYGGSNGIFVYLKALKPGSSDSIAYCSIERREAGSGDWQSLGVSKRPTGEADFTRQLKSAVASLPYDASFLNEYSRVIWKKYAGAGTTDTLKLWFGMLPVQEALGIVYHDLKAKPGVRYEYRVSQYDVDDNVLKTLYYIPASYPGEKSKWSMPYRSFSVMSDRVIVIWGAPGNKMPPYSVILRQERNGSDWTPIKPQISSFTARDSVFITATDTLVIPGAIYRYRIVPMDIFGNPGTATESEMVTAYNFRTQAPVIEDLKSGNPEGMPGIQLSWRISRNDLVNSIVIYRSNDYEKDYVAIAEVPSTSVSFIDQSVDPNVRYYYQIKLTGPMGEESAPSARIFAISDDRSMPAPPMITKATGTDKGIQLTIKLPESNISGIRVYRNSQDNSTMTPASGLIRATGNTVTWEDTASISPVKFYGYAARAENASHIQGDLSDTVYARSAKKAVTPEVIGLTADNRGDYNQLYWTDMHFIEAPLAGYIIYRRELPSGEMTQLNDTIISAERNSFTDRSVRAGQSYAYSVVLVDGFGNKGEKCPAVEVTVTTAPVRPPAGVAANAESDCIRVSWNSVLSPTLKEYRLYRYIRGGKPSPVATIKAGEATEYADRNVVKGQLYFYFLTTADADGRESNPSAEISIRKE